MNAKTLLGVLAFVSLTNDVTVRLYRPRAEILDGKWSFPEPQPVR